MTKKKVIIQEEVTEKMFFGKFFNRITLYSGKTNLHTIKNKAKKLIESETTDYKFLVFRNHKFSGFTSKKASINVFFNDKTLISKFLNDENLGGRVVRVSKVLSQQQQDILEGDEICRTRECYYFNKFPYKITFVPYGRLNIHKRLKLNEYREWWTDLSNHNDYDNDDYKHRIKRNTHTSDVLFLKNIEDVTLVKIGYAEIIDSIEKVILLSEVIENPK